MNCKSGDLAVIVRVRRDTNTWMIGRVVKCERMVVVKSEAFWRLETALPEPDPGIFEWRAIADYCLRPLRNPGDDAVDESKAWLPPVPLPTMNPELIPSKEEA